MSTERQRSVGRHLSAMFPRIPYGDAEAIRAHALRQHMRELTPAAAVWLAAIAHIRHAYTEYDALRDEGYELEEARFFVVEDTNVVLGRWGSMRQLSSEETEGED